jgi:hypothetical protein
MNLEQVKRELKELGRSPVAEKMYPITSDWVPMADVLAVINRFEKHWKQIKEKEKNSEKTKLINEILGEN